ncbi:EAL domain-containing protein [Pantoea agglomerans]|uniref:EAL domain-containing protein n=1 Tax=Enterobacter agglomerans TaxID=549 RepID=UPI0013BB6A9B|nr:EAL domain-containing protein [Pantoea agglomerans]NEG59929.1 EAL domain-containing protein [Pantoea agglomerans]NEH00921.1 EAL domain-containing protein [Pantoea agglomerans]NEH05096.1 EAL domain-containing protein [Pantoea agglomerans]NEH16042.1 EAL domain-containing protein [Pantoea agglomerans]
MHLNRIAIALDDFGTGYANLDYLNEIHVDLIKTDRSFVNGIKTEQQYALLLSNLIGMVRALNLKIIAEGVETEGLASRLAEKGVFWIQGYLYSRPVPLSQLQKMVYKNFLLARE